MGLLPRVTRRPVHSPGSSHAVRYSTKECPRSISCYDVLSSRRRSSLPENTGPWRVRAPRRKRPAPIGVHTQSWKICGDFTATPHAARPALRIRCSRFCREAPKCLQIQQNTTLNLSVKTCKARPPDQAIRQTPPEPSIPRNLLLPW